METKLKFKVGDKVRVKSLEWYNENKNEEGLVIDKMTGISGIYFNVRMSDFCGSILRIIEVDDDNCRYTMSGIVYYWQDWMLEDEAVTEEKQEQLNKNDMETKVMTKKEALEFLKDTKILCTSKAETIQVQVKLFQFGIEWISKTKGVCEDKYLLFINKEQELQHCSDIDFWMKDVNKRIEPSEILSIQIKEEKPKFDPKTLKPLDPVLVRMTKDAEWVLRQFEYYKNDWYETTSGTSWIYCVPYNDDTKHLHRTTNEAPEFYIGCEDF